MAMVTNVEPLQQNCLKQNQTELADPEKEKDEPENTSEDPLPKQIRKPLTDTETSEDGTPEREDQQPEERPEDTVEAPLSRKRKLRNKRKIRYTPEDPLPKQLRKPLTDTETSEDGTPEREDQQPEDTAEGPLSRKRKLSRDVSPPALQPGLPFPVDRADLILAGLQADDPYFKIKAVILNKTKGVSGVQLSRYTQFCNVFIKRWRFTSQFREINRTNTVVLTMLYAISRELYCQDLITVRGPADRVDVVKMLSEEILQDNTSLLTHTQNTITVLITGSMFHKYYLHIPKHHLKGLRTVNLGSSTEQWFKLKRELGMGSHDQLAGLLLHCYKAWSCVACARCRRHMEVGLQDKVRAVVGAHSVCVVSCSCGKESSGGFMIECDECLRWQHGVCVGIDKDSTPDHYVCGRCKRREVVPHQGGQDSDDESVESVDNTELVSTDDSGPEVIELD